MRHKINDLPSRCILPWILIDAVVSTRRWRSKSDGQTAERESWICPNQIGKERNEDFPIQTSVGEEKAAATKLQTVRKLHTFLTAELPCND
ncbi:hypothetical protein HFO74_35095 [Rhizobium laguerreae]|uniref:Uncharacterized protein n=1 Tax=Rhizobium laguerreae TaxID=1076926 RepID=A0AB35FRU5_9HYPH|nr:hypothetical protein [Rhizobium laguerreae]MBY3068556.1 hypothetical protein [Rhizobium laguerreae]